MNITELARILRVTPQELHDLLPKIGFNIGQKAIKVDNNTAKKIVKNWPNFKRQLEAQRAEAYAKRREEEAQPKEIKEISIPSIITVRDFAEVAQLPVNKILAELMKNGVFASINEKIDFDTATIISSELNLSVKELAESDQSEDKEDEKLEKILGRELKNNLADRPPVIVVMGHVDHGKTKLLDSIRTTNVIAGEAGGITQHIGAYQVTRKNKVITFIDTPGHEAFTAMRSRGAKVADIAILVVAADDGVKQQTIEAFRIIEAAKIPFIVAINKIDKEGADINKTKQELATQLNITPEDWGGKTICVPVSAKDGTGIEELLDMVLLVAEMENKNTRANAGSDAAGTVIESNVDKAAGPVATLLVQNGTLRVGDQLCFNNMIYGRVKSLKNYKGETVLEAGPSMPVKILGLKISPAIGDILEVGEGKKMKFKKIRSASEQKVHSASNNENNDENNIPELNLIIKADFLGSAEAIEESLLKINTEKVRARILYKGLGNVTEGDVKRASDSNAVIVGFNVKIVPTVENIVRDSQVTVKIYSVIYDLIKYVREEMQKMIKVEIKRIDEGRVKILEVFRTENDSQIVGGKVLDGEISNGGLIEVSRDGEIIVYGKLARLQSGKQDVSSVEANIECGIKYEGKPLIIVGDILNVYHEDKIIEKL
jgi:translation initiation factor IF-2